MKRTIDRLEKLIDLGLQYISKSSVSALTQRSNPEKWSKKEILGHLIDSGINNLQRFTEIQFENKPYKIKPYNQEGLVKANDYQHSEIKDTVAFWVAINKRIIRLMQQQTETTLAFKIEFDNGNQADLRFLMVDYVDHLEHHLNQIK